MFIDTYLFPEDPITFSIISPWVLLVSIWYKIFIKKISLLFIKNNLQDILFDAKTHKIKKFIVHTNFPGHYNFNM